MTRFIYSPVYSVLFCPDLFFLSKLVRGMPLDNSWKPSWCLPVGSEHSSGQFLHFTPSNPLLLGLPITPRSRLPALTPRPPLISYTKQCTPLPVHLGCCSHPFLSMLSLLRCLPVRPAWETILERKRQARQGQGLMRKKEGGGGGGGLVVEGGRGEQCRAAMSSPAERQHFKSRDVRVMKVGDTQHTHRCC